MNKRILYLIKTLNIGGSERLTYNLANYMQRTGNDVSIYSSGGVFVDELRGKNIGYIYSENAKEIGIKGFWKIRKEIGQIVKKKDFNIIHCFDRFFVFILKTLPIKNAKIIYSAGNYYADFYQSFLRPDFAVAISPAIEKNLADTVKIKRDRIRRINYGVPMPDPVPWKKRKGDQPENITIGFIGNIMIEKGILNLLEAFSDLVKNHSEIRLKIIGDGPDKFTVMNFINDKGLQEYVDFAASYTDPDAIYKNIDILILPSQMKEGLPISILEAMARGILTISTSSEAIKDLLINEETGIVLKTGKRQEIFNSLNNILTSYPNLEKMLSKAKETVTENYSLDEMLLKYSELYRSI